MNKRFPRLMGYGLVAMLPALLTLLVIYGAFRASLTDFQPYQDSSDNLFYWRQIYTFSEVGFNGGYYSALESSARAPFSHFHAQGPVFPIVYGTIGAFFGWYPASPPLLNMILLTLSLGVFLAIVQPSGRQLLLMGGVVVTSWIVLMYLPSSMAEALHHSLSLIVIALLYRMTREKKRSEAVLLWMLIFILSLLRITWALLYIVYFWLLIPVDSDWKNRLQALILAGVSAGLAFVIGVAYLSAPYPYNFRNQLLTDAVAADGPLSGIIQTLSRLVEQTLTNLGHILSFEDALLSATMLELIVLTIVLVGLIVSRRMKTPESGWRGLTFHLMGLVIVAPIWILTLALREFGPDSSYRVMSAHLFMFAMLVVAYNRRWFAIGLIAMAIASGGFFLSLYQWNLSYHLFYDDSESIQFADEVASYIVYDGAADSAWCNTMLFNYTFSYRPALMGLPAGIGGTFFAKADEPFELPLKSRYLLLPPADATYFQTFTDMTYLTTTAIGDLYLNDDADCEPM